MGGNKQTTTTPFLIIGLLIAAYLLYSGGRQYATGAPVEEWIVDLIAGISFLTICVVISVGYRLETDRSQAADSGRTDWIVLFLFGSWGAIGALFYLVGYRLPRLYFFSAMGGVGVVLMGYAMWTSQT